ncbi:MAG: ComF family protein [Candidatus Limnocylindrales bacterium]
MRRLLDLLLPPTCAGCGLEGVPLCSRCRVPLARRLDEPPGMPLGLIAPLPVGIVQLEWCATFGGPVREALHALKYRGERRLAPTLAGAMAERWRRAGRGGEVVVPVPVHPARRRERGFDQAEDLARGVAAELRLPWSYALERRTRTLAQHALGRTERAANLVGAFAVRPDRRGVIAGRWVLLIDDVTTTGATLAECACALRDAGARAVSALTLARDR